jgi:hypothetical protein
MAKKQRPFLCFVILILCYYTHLQAQDSIVKIPLPLDVNGSLYYDFPQSFGALAGIVVPFRSKLVTTIAKKSGKKEEKNREVIVAGDLGFYRYPYNNSGLYFDGGIGKRYYREHPYFFEWLIKVGLLRTFYDGLVYSVDGNGNVSVLKNFGRYYALTGITTVFGYDFQRSKKPQPFALAFKPSVWVQYPYNSFILPHVSCALTFEYRFNRIKRQVQQKRVLQIDNK